MIKTVLQFLHNTFQIIVLDLSVTKRSLLLERLEKKLGKDAKQNYNAAFSHL